MKKLILIITIFISINGFSQVSKVSLQASGLTCSMCSNAINKALRSVDYVDRVMANIKTSTFDIYFKPGAKVNFDQLKKKVEDAGFSTAKFVATIQFDNTRIENDEHENNNGMVLHFLNVKDQKLSGEKEIQIIDKGYVSAKQFKKSEVYTKMKCYKTGVAGSCCDSYGLTPGTRIFHVTLI
jgi:copper chaperone CopZ